MFRKVFDSLSPLKRYMKLEYDTDLQVDLQALVIDFCLKGNKMELLCDNQRGLQKAQCVKIFMGCTCESKINTFSCR